MLSAVSPTLHSVSRWTLWVHVKSVSQPSYEDKEKLHKNKHLRDLWRAVSKRDQPSSDSWGVIVAVCGSKAITKNLQKDVTIIELGSSMNNLDITRPV